MLEQLSMPGSECTREELIADLVASCPKTIWIELTSKCPFDCIFCSRKHERGNGQHMSFALYESLIGQLQQPELIRLNYSGESMHYPWLSDAIRLARGTGATTELVSALGSATHGALESLVDAGLHRLSVSIHSLDPAQFRMIYGRGDVSDIRDRLDYLERYKTARGSKYPEIDFAFVAMEENLAQLLPVVEYASARGVTQLSIHPVIQRGTAPLQFPREVDDTGNLRGEFAARVIGEAGTVSALHPGVSITIARPDPARQVHMDVNHRIKTSPGGVTMCEQNPWDTIHVLAHGSVVICEVQDRVEIGNLHRQTLAEIWNGSQYQDFRRQYLTGEHPVCAACPWRRTVPLSEGRKILVRGWHPAPSEEAQWSEASAAVAVAVGSGVTGIRVAGLLPPAPSGNAANSLAIRLGKSEVAHIVNETEELIPFEAVVPVAAGNGFHPVVLRFETQYRFRPVEQGRGPDLRNLGFALTELNLQYDQKRHKTIARLLNLLRQIERIAVLQPALRWMVPKEAAPPRQGLSVVVPARDTPDLLAPALSCAEAAIARIGEASELVVVVSGAHSEAYGELRSIFPRAKWIFRAEPLGYLAAIEVGISCARHPWIYLLNSDMHLHPDALAETLKLRRWDTFAIGSRIRMQDGSDTETNWTDLRYCEGDAAELTERNPAGLSGPRGCLYVGGGSGLFRASLLRRFARRTRAYAPFYWEDAEWGTLAWRYGYHCAFCPTSEAVHGHRQTVARYYSEPEISRVFERNRLLFHLRNLGGLWNLEQRLLSLDTQSWADVFQPGVLLDTARARATAFMAPRNEDVLRDRWKISF